MKKILLDTIIEYSKKNDVVNLEKESINFFNCSYEELLENINFLRNEGYLKIDDFNKKLYHITEKGKSLESFFFSKKDQDEILEKKKRLKFYDSGFKGFVISIISLVVSIIFIIITLFIPPVPSKIDLNIKVISDDQKIDVQLENDTLLIKI